MRGIIYAHAGQACLTRLIVSMYSLRRYWDGPATVFQEDKALPELRAICKDLNIDLVEYEPNKCNNYTKKCYVNLMAPYKATMFLDADTLVCGPLDEYFEWIERYGLVFTNFSNWTPDGNMMSKRIRSWENLYPQHVESALKYPVAINTGTYGFQKDHPFLEGWLNTCLEGDVAGVPLTDELTAQLLAQFFEHYVAPIEWGYSVKYGEEIEPLAKARVIHYHGRKHIGDNECQKLWKKTFYEAHEKYGLQGWGDKRVHKMLGNKAGGFKLPLEGAAAPGSSRKHPQSDKVTYVTAVDEKYLASLKANYPTWRLESIQDCKLIVFHDASVSPEDLDFLEKDVKLVSWDMPEDWSQRERMLSAFVLGAPHHVETEYWVKLDADVAVSRAEAMHTWEDDWLEHDVVAHKWTYTRPKGGTWEKHWLNMLDEWWKELTGDEPMFEPIEDPMSRFSHKRIASFYCFHRTSRSKELMDLCGDRLPIPSHDTVLWYVATRKGWKVGMPNIKRKGMIP